MAVIGEIHIQAHKESRLTVEELLEAVFSLHCSSWLYRADISVLWLADISRVEAGSNTSTVVLQVVGGGKKGTQCLGV
jgi:hypothetical protein